MDYSAVRERQNNHKNQGIILTKEGVKAMKTENTKAQMRKGILEYCILLVMSEKPQYAITIIEDLKKAKMIVVEGTLYPLLTRLKNEGLLTYKWEESTLGPPRKYYQLTEKGTEFLHELETSWFELTGAVDKIREKRA